MNDPDDVERIRAAIKAHEPELAKFLAGIPASYRTVHVRDAFRLAWHMGIFEGMALDQADRTKSEKGGES